MSALPPKADMCSAVADVRYGPIADAELMAITLKFSYPARRDTERVKPNIPSFSSSGGAGMDLFGLEVLAALVAACIFAAGWWLVGWLLRGQREAQKLRNAPANYANRLGELIERAHREGKELAVVNAKARVSVRNDMRDSLITISKNLNSEISQLQGLLFGEIDAIDTEFRRFDTRRTTTPRAPDPLALYEIFEVLHRTWPEKKIIIETQLRKQLTELGLESV